MSFNSNTHFSLTIHTRSRPCCNIQCGKISTEMKVHFKLNQISTEQFIVPTRFDLYDDFYLRCVWKLRFIFPMKCDDIANLLERFARQALASDLLLMNIGVKDISEINKVFSLIPTELETLACEFNSKGISVLDDETLYIPDGTYENSPNVKLEWGILHHFYWTNWEIKKDKLETKKQFSNSTSSSEESSMESVDNTKRGFDTCGRYSFH